MAHNFGVLAEGKTMNVGAPRFVTQFPHLNLTTDENN